MMTEKKWVRCENNKIIAGVSAGLARYLNIDVNLTRMIVFFAFVATAGIVLLAYIVAIIILPKEKCAEVETTKKTLTRCTNNKLIGGVSSGFAKFINVDVNLVRILFFIGLFLTGGALFWTYLAAFVILPAEEC
ncbi:MAG: PspC domain-containing protein [Candidatus Heimdallarchaeaceae archaeon]